MQNGCNLTSKSPECNLRVASALLKAMNLICLSESKIETIAEAINPMDDLKIHQFRVHRRRVEKCMKYRIDTFASKENILLKHILYS